MNEEHIHKCAESNCNNPAVVNGDFCRFHSDNLSI